MEREEPLLPSGPQLQRLMKMTGEHEIDPQALPARRGLPGPPRRMLAVDPFRAHEVVMRDDDAKERRGRLGKQPIDFVETPTSHPAPLERQGLGGVHTDDQKLAVPVDRLELAVEVAPPGPVGRKKPLPDPVERDVVIARNGDDRRDLRKLRDEPPRLGELPRLRAQGEVAGDHDEIGPAPRGEAEHALRNAGKVLRPEVDVRDVQDLAQSEASAATLAYGSRQQPRERVACVSGLAGQSEPRLAQKLARFDLAGEETDVPRTGLARPRLTP